MSYVPARRRDSNNDANRLYDEDRAAHAWYRFVLSFPPHLVRHYLERFGVGAGQRVLDPFCGTGTTVVECKKRGVVGVGIEGNPVAHFAGCVKTSWRIEGAALLAQAERIAGMVCAQFAAQGLEDSALRLPMPDPATLRSLPPEQAALLLTNSISALPLHKTLLLREAIASQASEAERGHLLLALARALVSSIGNLHFGPEVGLGVIKTDVAVVAPWLANVRVMAQDLATLREWSDTPAPIYLGDARDVTRLLEPCSIDAVITSPPYPNEKDYTRTTRLEAVLLGFIGSKTELRALKKGLVRSNTRGVYKEDDDDTWVAALPQIQALADSIERRRVELGKTSGFERLYARVTRLYFGGIARHLAGLRTCLRPGAQLAYIVGDQASYLRVMIRTGQILAQIAQHLGYEVVGIDLFRTRLASATRAQLREEVVVLRWPGT